MGVAVSVALGLAVVALYRMGGWVASQQGVMGTPLHDSVDTKLDTIINLLLESRVAPMTENSAGLASSEPNKPMPPRPPAAPASPGPPPALAALTKPVHRIRNQYPP